VGRPDETEPGRGARPPVEEPLVGLGLVGLGRENPPDEGRVPCELVGPVLGRTGVPGRADGIVLGRTPALDPRDGLGEADGRE